MKKSALFFIVTLLLFAFLAGCDFPGRFFQSIEDVNGPDDFTLCSVTEEDICQSQSYFSIGVRHIDGRRKNKNQHRRAVRCDAARRSPRQRQWQTARRSFGMQSPP